MGNAAAVSAVAESSRRRILIKRHLKAPTEIVWRSLLEAIEVRAQQTSACFEYGFIGVEDLWEVLQQELQAQCSVKELVALLKQLGCRMEIDQVTEQPSCVSFTELVAYFVPRRKPRADQADNVPCDGDMTIWKAAIAGDLNAVRSMCTAHPAAYRAKDAEGGTPLYYAVINGHDAIVDYVMRQHERAQDPIAPDEYVRCAANAHDKYVRALLEEKMTLIEAALARQQDGSPSTVQRKSLSK